MLAAGARSEGRSDITHTSVKRTVVVSGDRCESAVLGDPAGRLAAPPSLPADRERTLTSNELDNTPSRTHFRTVLCFT